MLRSLCASYFLFAFVLGCGSGESRPAECKEIFEACHPFDPGSGPIHQCHENSEEKWTKDTCVANRSMCLTVCKAAGAGTDASARD